MRREFDSLPLLNTFCKKGETTMTYDDIPTGTVDEEASVLDAVAESIEDANSDAGQQVEE